MSPITEKPRQSTFEQTLLSARRTMLMSEILKLAMDSFRASKTRFMLTALGMVIGTASVILVVTIGMTGKQYILDLIQKIGTNSVELEYAGGGATPAERVRYNDYLTREDERIVDQQVPGVMYSSPVLEMHNRLSFPGGTKGHNGARRQPGLPEGPQPDRHRRAFFPRHRRLHACQVCRGYPAIRQGALRQR